MPYDFDHLKDYSETTLGPIQSDEALFLFGLVKVIRPRVIVEFGFLKGDSSLNFLKAMPTEGILYSFDCDGQCQAAAKAIQDSRFKFVLKKQQDFEPQDIDHRKIDFLFIDASHQLSHNILLFKKIKKCLAQDALIVIHDTGTWNKRLLSKDFPGWKDHMKNLQMKDTNSDINVEEFAHQPDERRFANCLKTFHPEFEQIHFHSRQTLRHGLTILQHRRKLKLGPKIGFEIKKYFEAWKVFWGRS